MSEANPFEPSDADHHAIWEMLVRRDIEAFLAADWPAFAGCFLAEGFLGIDARRSRDPGDWLPRFSTLEAYRDAWLAAAGRSAALAHPGLRRAALYRATDMRDIRVSGNAATARKRLDGAIPRRDGETDTLDWQSLFLCARFGNAWKITGFIGYMPLDA